MDDFNDPHVLRARRNRVRPAHGQGTLPHPGTSQLYPGAVAAVYQPVKKQDHLGVLSLGALTLNRIIGTGIFTGPQVVLAITGSKGVTIVLWIICGIIAWAGVSVYLEYGIRFPLTGGELHYIDYVWKKPKKLMTYLYSIMFITLSGSHGGALVFGSAVITASTPAGTKIDRRLQKLFAILLVAVVCLFQSISRLNYIRFSDGFALYKTCLCSFIILLGMIALAGKTFAEPAPNTPYGVANLEGSFSDATLSPYIIAISILQIMRAYFGYENVNYILEEVKRGPDKDPHRVYRRAVKISVLMVTFFYVMIVVSFFAASTTDELIKSPDMLTLFFQKLFGKSPRARTASGILLCMSAAGNVMSATYTNTRVKQEIGREGIIPWPEFWSRSTHMGTPGPSLLLHWIFSTILIIAAPLDDPNGYLIISTLYHYCRTLMGVLLGSALLAAPWLNSFAATDDQGNTIKRWTPRGSRVGIVTIWPLALIYLAANLFVFVVSWFPPNLENRLHTNSKIVTSYAGPTTAIIIYVMAAMYWLWDIHILPRLGWHFKKLKEEIKDDGSIRLRFDRSFEGLCEKLGVERFISTLKHE
ncbi:amino acid transporter [Amniculicola lignicola CBS 123094]|uniref:Amino acid transporter n=1 Tax=Amniculicola lignicola CBS 123094 TaxID=1392246 RepID=A0A6A5WAG3_9PLEO|nr:amino acid transporter [Amniculicola lignicola CBS 123094]